MLQLCIISKTLLKKKNPHLNYRTNSHKNDSVHFDSHVIRCAENQTMCIEPTKIENPFE